MLYVTGADGTVQRLTTAPEPFVSSYTEPIATPQLWTSDDGTWVVLSHSDRSAARQYLWRLDEPCASATG